ncbi:ATP-binding protein [Streptomyces sp. HSW2009]|uniref:ATP-binding protein n=1 Tax=Streptomyces sp. HSW2009 TaxID=3142890 RepID=UPI0032F07E00
MISSPSRHCTVEVQVLPERIGQVRRIVSAQLRYWHLDQLIESVALGVSELLTNVYLHAEPDKRCTVDLVWVLDQLTVSVRDRDVREPAPPAPGPLGTHGRGLALVAAVSQSWGVRQVAGGKAVWFALPVGWRAEPWAQRPGRAAGGPAYPSAGEPSRTTAPSTADPLGVEHGTAGPLPVDHAAGPLPVEHPVAEPEQEPAPAGRRSAPATTAG